MNGVTAFVLKSVTARLSQGIVSTLESWPLYTVAVTGPREAARRAPAASDRYIVLRYLWPG